MLVWRKLSVLSRTHRHVEMANIDPQEHFCTSCA